MPVPHLEIRIVQRSKGSSAVAGAAYQAGEKLFSEYDQKMKNYLYKKEVVYTEVMLPTNMPSSEADKHGYERANKHPKSTKFGRQNPIAERWNSEEQLIEWRKAWADVTNRYLERYGHDERIDHRSHADRGLTEQPTIHEGVVARALEKKGNEKLHSDGINEKLRSQFVVTLKLIPKAVVLIVDVFFHDMCPPYVNLILR